MHMSMNVCSELVLLFPFLLNNCFRRQHGRSCKALGDYHLLLGEYNKALDFYREGLATLEKLSKKV